MYCIGLCVAFTSSHVDCRLFGIVNRVSGETSDVNKPKFLCHVMEAETTGSKVS